MRKISIFIFCLFIYSHLSIGQEEQQYAGTAMPYPSLENSSYLVQDGMVPFYINHLGRHGARFPTSGKALDKVITRLSLTGQKKVGLYFYLCKRYLSSLRANGVNYHLWAKKNKRVLLGVCQKIILVYLLIRQRWRR